MDLRWEYKPAHSTDAGLRYQTFRPGQSYHDPIPANLTAASQANLGYPDNQLQPPGGSAAAVFSAWPGRPRGQKVFRKGLTEQLLTSLLLLVLELPWDPKGDGKTTVRGGWGLFYNPIEPTRARAVSGLSRLSAVARSSQKDSLARPFVLQDGNSGAQSL